MGLDQFAYRMKKGLVEVDVDFSTEEYNEETLDYDVVVDKTEIHYWRKRPSIQGWMQELYESKGGENPEFNCSNVKLDMEDLLELQRDIINGSLSSRFQGGFFFGSDRSNGEDEKEDDLEFVSKAIVAITDGDEIYYSSWW
jgi:hypothetical protein